MGWDYRTHGVMINENNVLVERNENNKLIESSRRR
jgi:hypothetical protein